MERLAAYLSMAAGESNMIRQALTVLFCAVLFLAVTTPARAEHPFATGFVCITMKGAMIAVAMTTTGQDDALRHRALSEDGFPCFIVEFRSGFQILELVHEYKVEGVHKGVVRALDPWGREVYCFGSIKYINKFLHRRGV